MLVYKEIHYKKKLAKGEWRPKCRWLVSFTIKLDKPNKTKYQYYTPKNAEEEKKLEEDFNEKMSHILDIILGSEISKIIENKNL